MLVAAHAGQLGGQRAAFSQRHQPAGHLPGVALVGKSTALAPGRQGMQPWTSAP